MPNSGERLQDRKTLARSVIVFVAVQVFLAMAVSSIKLRTGAEDTDAYCKYARMTLEGYVPYRDFRIEYPPLALPLFLAPGLISLGVNGYRIAFAVEMLLFNAATVWLVADWVERRQGLGRVRSRLAWYSVFFALMARHVVVRYDSAPTLLAFAASAWWFSGRGGLGGMTAALGALMKVFPASVAVVAAAWDLTRPGAREGAVSPGSSRPR